MARPDARRASARIAGDATRWRSSTNCGLAALIERIDCDLALGPPRTRPQRAEPARARAPVAGTAARPADARPLPCRPASGRARRIRRGAPHTGRRPRHRAERGAATATAGDPPPRPGPRDARGHRRDERGPQSAAAPPSPTPIADAGLGEGHTRRGFRPRRWQLALAGFVILAGSAVAAAILSTSAGASRHVVPNSLVRIDPRSGKIVSVIPVGAEPQEIAATPRGIWTDNLTEGTVTRYDLRTHNVETLGTPPEPFDVAADAGNTWVSSLRNSSIITRFAFGTGGASAGWGPLNPSDTSEIHLPPPGAVSLALGLGYLWAVAGPKTTPGTERSGVAGRPGEQSGRPSSAAWT